MHKTDISYVAGLFDGEGTIVIQRDNGYSLRCSIENTDRAVIKWLEDNFGGSTREVKGVRKRKWQWVIRCRDAWRFLLLVRPYLKIKDAQARIAIAFQETKVNLRGKADVADLEMKCREAFACRLSEANR